MTEQHDHAACVEQWRQRLGDDLDAAALIRAFERAYRAVWGRTKMTLGDVTLVAIGDRVLHDAAEQHPILRDVRLDVAGISCDELQRRAPMLDMAELEQAVRTVLTELLEVLDRLTGGVLTAPLQAALADDRDEGPAT
jgi:hypothetical protein